MDFDLEIDRKHSASLKWDHYKGTEVEPFWVADMDFSAPPEVLQALHERVDHGVFGYTLPPDELNDVVVARLAAQYGWKIRKEWLVWLPGIVPALETCCRAFGGDNGDVITFTPIYPPFMSAPQNNAQNTIAVPLVEIDGVWCIDYDLLEAAITSKTKLLLLCNPHNPVGRVFTRDELEQLCAFCEQHDLIICSDEIHCELILDEELKHIPTATVGKSIELRTITLMAPSKTFNIAGLSCAFAVIPNADCRDKFLKAKEGIVPYVNTLGYTAALAAYRDASQWHEELLVYLRGNRDVLEKTLDAVPGLKVAHIEATYLAWIDCRELNIEDPVAFFEKANVGLSCGEHFGLEGYVRFNFACTRKRMIAALDRMVASL